MGIDWKVLSPAKAGGRVVRADVLAFASTRATGPASAAVASGTPARVIPYAGIRRIIGERLGESARTIPTVALTLHAEVGKLTAWREGLKENNFSVGYTEMMVMIVARALREHPIMNSKLVGDEIHLVGEINVGVAVDTDRGLMVPVIRDVGCKGLREISEEYRRKVQAAKSGRAGADDLTGGTFTLTNLGMFGIEGFVPIINLPECCILGLGAIRRESVVREDDSVDIVSRMRMTLVFDHRIVDGAPAARFLQRIKHLVEWPMELLS
jgi:pyruvate dehydrogenase E2 component (dihydrolipoamide acetyltransferase)